MRITPRATLLLLPLIPALIVVGLWIYFAVRDLPPRHEMAFSYPAHGTTWYRHNFRFIDGDGIRWEWWHVPQEREAEFERDLTDPAKHGQWDYARAGGTDLGGIGWSSYEPGLGTLTRRGRPPQTFPVAGYSKRGIHWWFILLLVLSPLLINLALRAHARIRAIPDPPRKPTGAFEVLPPTQTPPGAPPAE